MSKKHTYEDRLKYMKMLEEGYSVTHISTYYGISHHLLDVLWSKYQKEGAEGLKKKAKHPFRWNISREGSAGYR